MSTKFWINTLAHAVTPGGYGYNRKLRKFKNPSFNIERDRHPVRRKHRGSQGWQNKAASDLIYRDYANYEEYTTHQSQKYREILQSAGGFNGLTIARWRIRFHRRFRTLLRLLPFDAKILCAGARQGTEVEVLRELGFKNTYGIDLNPGPNNPFVIPGDFLHINEPDQSIDLLYTNSIDHAYNLDELFREHYRVIKPGGYALYDIPAYQDDRATGPFEAVQWKSLEDLKNKILNYFDEITLEQAEPNWSWVLVKKTE